MSIEKYGSAQSATQANTLVSQLSPAALDAELSYWQKEVAKYDKSIKGTAAGSSERGKLAQQLELAMERLIQTQAVLAQKSKDYQPIAGPPTPSIKKDIAAANKYKGLNVDSLVSTAESIRSGMMPSGTSPRSFVLGSVTASLLQPVLSKNWTATQTAGRPTTVEDTDQRGFNEAIQEAMRTGQATTPAPTATPGTTTSPTVTSTPGGGGRGRGTVVFDGKRVKVGSDKWKTIIQEEFGGLWDVYNDNADVKKVIDRAVKEGWFNDEIKLSESLRGTNWYRTTEQSARQYAIQLSTDPATMEARINEELETLRAGSLAVGLTLDDGTLRRIATNKVKFGWSPQQTSNAIGSEAVALAQTGGAQGMTDLRQGSVGRKLRETARLYAQKPADADLDTWVSDIMTGSKTETQWEDFMRNSAKTQFRSLTPALDRGDTVEDATYAYRQQALQTLGGTIDPSQIDWTQDKWNKALNFNDPKTNESRQMDLWEWNKYLRTLPEWQQTDDAKQVYRNVAYSLAQGFGKMA